MPRSSVHTKAEVLHLLKEHLQTAIELEHSTLPPYLCALWSVHGTSADAQRAAKVILSVIQEEMLHMAMACNLLNAIGGTPVLNDPARLPVYPCVLPGHSRTTNAFMVHLDKCCVRCLNDLIRIEMPGQMASGMPAADGWRTIGEFYDGIEALIKDEALTDDDFKHGRQLGSSYGPDHGVLYTVQSRADALKALEEIIDQGEGHSAGMYDRDHELTHYWKFVSVRDLMRTGIWKYEEDVLDMAMDPDEAFFDETAIQLNRTVNVLFSDLLDAMQAAFTSTTPALDEAIRIMFLLEKPARQLMRIPLVGRPGNAGPTFRYIAAADR